MGAAGAAGAMGAVSAMGAADAAGAMDAAGAAGAAGAMGAVSAMGAAGAAGAMDAAGATGAVGAEFSRQQAAAEPCLALAKAPHSQFLQPHTDLSQGGSHSLHQAVPQTPITCPPVPIQP